MPDCEILAPFLQQGYVTGHRLPVPPTQSDREVLTGLAERVTYQNAKDRGHRELVTLVGHAPAIFAGEWVMAAATGSTTAPTVSSSRPGSARPLRPSNVDTYCPTTRACALGTRSIQSEVRKVLASDTRQ